MVLKLMRKLVLSLGLLTLTIAPIVMSNQLVYADLFGGSQQAACQGVGLGSDGCGTDQTGSINGIIGNVINILSVVVGIAAIIVLIISGLRFITSAGDPAKISGAKSSIIWAMVGLVLVVLAQIIIHFVIGKVL